MLAELKPLPYNERLRALNLLSLEHRHRRGDMIDAYKYIRGIANSSYHHHRYWLCLENLI